MKETAPAPGKAANTGHAAHRPTSVEPTAMASVPGQAPAPPTGPTIGGVQMATVNETPLSFPPFDPQPGQPASAAAETQQSSRPTDIVAAPPASPEAATPPPLENSIAPPPAPAGVALSDDNPWKS